MPRGGEHMQVFSGPLRQHGAGFGALAAGVGRVAIPLIRQYVVPAAKKYALPVIKRVGRDLVQAAIPEMSSVIQGKKRGRQALKSALKTTASKQFGGAGPGRRRRTAGGRRTGGIKKRKAPATRKRKTATTRKSTRSIKGSAKKRPASQLSRHNFFSSIDAGARV